MTIPNSQLTPLTQALSRLRERVVSLSAHRRKDRVRANSRFSVFRFRFSFLAPILLLTAYCSLLTTAALWAAGCGSDTKDEAQDVADGGGEGDGFRASRTMKGTITVTWLNPVTQEDTTKTTKLDPNDGHFAFDDRCLVDTTIGHYAIGTDEGSFLFAVDEGTYAGPGTYHGADVNYDIECTITVEVSEKSGRFDCFCPPTRQCLGDVRTVKGEYECLGPFERE